MAIQQLQLPGYATPQTIDFSPLAQLGQTYQKSRQDAVRQQTLASLGQGGPADATALMRSGDMQLAQLGMTLQQQQAQDAWRREEAQRTQANADRSFGLQERAAARADEGPVETAAQRAAAARANGVDPTTPQGKAYILTGKLPEADTSFNSTIEQRKQAAISNGLDPSSPGFQSFVLTGKMPREDAQPQTATDKKAILEADEMVLANTAAIDSLKRAQGLSKEAFAGPTAAERGYAASFLGPSSDWGKAGIATESLKNEVETNALSQLKAIFGGAPTEGERKILLDLQGSASKAPAVRDEIYKRAESAASKRLEFNRQRADALRGQTYYKPGGNNAQRAPATSASAPTGAPITQAEYAALPSGATFTAPDGTQRVKP